MPKILFKDTFISYLQTGDMTQLPEKMEDGFKIEEFVEVSELSIHPSISELRDFNFDQGIEFTGCDFGKGLTLVNCKGRGRIKFINCKSKKIDLNDPTTGLHLQGVTFDHFLIDLCIFPNGFLIDKPHQKDENNILSSLTIRKSSFEEMGITLDSTTINQNLEFFQVTGSKNIKLNNLEVGHNLTFYHVEAEEIEFTGEKSTFKSNVSLSRLISKKVSFQNGTIGGNLKISEPRIDGILSFNNLSISGNSKLIANEKIEFHDLKTSQKFHVSLPELKIESTEFNGGFTMEGDNLTSKSISIDFSPLLKGRLVFSYLKLGKLMLKGTNSENNLYFRNMGFEEILIDEFLNLKTLSFTNLDDEFTKSKKSSFKILDSDLGNWELLNFDFNAFSKINWKDSNIVGLRTSVVGWFSEKKFEADGELIPATCLRRREFYRQLKQSCEKQGDRINELEFKRRELKAYKKALEIRKEKKIDRFTIWTGGSNNHGQNWIKPLLLIFFLTLIVFYPLIIITSDPSISWKWDWSPEGWNLFWTKIGNHFDIFWQLFNPTRRVKDMFPGQVSASAHFWDGFQRIVLAFFIFQIVSAFRKFVK